MLLTFYDNTIQVMMQTLAPVAACCLIVQVHLTMTAHASVVFYNVCPFVVSTTPSVQLSESVCSFLVRSYFDDCSYYFENVITFPIVDVQHCVSYR